MGAITSLCMCVTDSTPARVTPAHARDPVATPTATCTCTVRLGCLWLCCCGVRWLCAMEALLRSAPATATATATVGTCHCHCHCSCATAVQQAIVQRSQQRCWTTGMRWCVCVCVCVCVCTRIRWSQCCWLSTPRQPSAPTARATTPYTLPSQGRPGDRSCRCAAQPEPSPVHRYTHTLLTGWLQRDTLSMSMSYHTGDK
jgi:hypothetical protein